MSYSVKRGRVAKCRIRVGDVISIDYVTDPNGHYWWRCEWYAPENMYGPFPTREEAQTHSEVTVLGPQCKVKDGGQWHPAWERPQ
jgi:hypothetical protein